MLDKKEILRQVVSYLLAKNKNFSNEVLQEIIFVANLQHLIYYGRLINEIYKPDIAFLETLRKNTVDRFDHTSESDRKSLDDAILRTELDGMSMVIKVLGA